MFLLLTLYIGIGAKYDETPHSDQPIYLGTFMQKKDAIEHALVHASNAITEHERDLNTAINREKLLKKLRQSLNKLSQTGERKYVGYRYDIIETN